MDPTRPTEPVVILQSGDLLDSPHVPYPRDEAPRALRPPPEPGPPLAPDGDGMVGLEAAFKGSWSSAAATARALGIPIDPDTMPAGSHRIPFAAVVKIREAWARGQVDRLASRTVTPDHISHVVLDHLLHPFGALHWARVAGVPTIKPTESEDEHFLRFDDLAAVLEAARAHGHDPAAIAGARVDRALATIDRHGLRGLAWREIRRRKLL